MAKITKACKGVSYPKPSNVSRKLKSGGSLGMKSVKAGYDKNPGVTRADIIVAGKGQAKKGMKIKKAQGGDSLSIYKASPEVRASYTDRAKSTGYKAPVQNPKFQIDMEKKKNSDSMKKPIPPAKKGATMKKCKYGCK